MPRAPMTEKQPPSPIYKRHEALKEWLEELLRCWEAKPKPEEEKDEEEDKEEAKDSKESEEDGNDPILISRDNPKMETVHTVAPDARKDGMPPGVPYDPNAIYIRCNKKHLDEKTLKYFNLPWSVVKEEPDFYVIWQNLTMRETDELFEHTRRIRMLDEQATVKPPQVIDALLRRWLDVDPLVEAESESRKERDEELEQFEKDLEDLRIDAEKPKEVRRPIGPHNYPPPPAAPRHNRPFKGTTDYWKPWSEDSWSLYSSMKRNGWKPIYTRGNDNGQTWYHGDKCVHVRRFNEDYTPQGQPAKSESLANGYKEYLIIGKEWVEEEAIIRSGFDYRSMKDSWALDPRLTWFDIDILTAATSAFREERIFRKYRNSPGGDLHGQVRVPFPEEDYLQGPELSSFTYGNFGMNGMPQPVQRHQIKQHHPTRLDDIVEETPVHEAPAQVARSPTIESHDSFIEVEK